MIDPLIYHLDQRECAALDRGNVTEREHVERHAGACAHRFRRPVTVCCDDPACCPDGPRCYFTIDQAGRVVEAEAERIPDVANEERTEAGDEAAAIKAARKAVKERAGAAEACALIHALDPLPAALEPLWVALEGAELSGDYADAEAALDALDRA